MKVAILLLSVVVLSQAESWVAAPYTLVKRAAQPEPQRGGSRPGTRFGFGRPSSSSSGSSGQNTRFFTGNQAIDAGAAGAAAGFAGASLVNNAQGNPCASLVNN